MKYLILRKHRAPARNAFTERVSAGQTAGHTLPFRMEVADLPDGDVADIRADPEVEDVVPSMPLTLVAPVTEAPAAATSAKAWGLDAVGATHSPWDGSGVTVAVLDTGIDTNHPAFAGLTFDRNNLMDFTRDENGEAGIADDLAGHGTHVAGTIFGRDVGGTRIGVAPGIRKILIGKVIGSGEGSTEAILNAIAWAQRQRADIITMSLGIDYSRFVRQLIQSDLPPDIASSRALAAYRSTVRVFDRLVALIESRAGQGRGALLVAASGNESRRKEDARFTVAVAPPAAADGVIAVAAVGPPDAAGAFTVAPFSNTGGLMAAPGIDILSARRGGGLALDSGTSMAAPHMAGVLALWTQKLFPGGARPPTWTQDVQREVGSHVRVLTGQRRSDVGLGLVQAPRDRNDREGS